MAKGLFVTLCCWASLLVGLSSDRQEDRSHICCLSFCLSVVFPSSSLSFCLSLSLFPPPPHSSLSLSHSLLRSLSPSLPLPSPPHVGECGCVATGRYCCPGGRYGTCCRSVAEWCAAREQKLSEQTHSGQKPGLSSTTTVTIFYFFRFLPLFSLVSAFYPLSLPRSLPPSLSPPLAPIHPSTPSPPSTPPPLLIPPPSPCNPLAIALCRYLFTLESFS